jgi:uncharacterized protein (TIGR03000 family)
MRRLKLSILSLLAIVVLSWLCWASSSAGFFRRCFGPAPCPAVCEPFPLVLWQFAAAGMQQGGGGPTVDPNSRKAHFLLLLDSRDPAGGAEASEEAARIEHLIFSLPRDERGTFTAIQGDALTRDNVLQTVRNLPVGPNEALLVWASLRGAKTPEKAAEQLLPMASGPALARQDLLDALRDKNARLGVLISDAALPAGGLSEEPVIRRKPRTVNVSLRVGPAVEATLHDLLGNEKGLVNIASAGPGEYAFHDVFAPAFLEQAEGWDELRDGRATWDAFFARLKTATADRYAARQKDLMARGTISKEMASQKAQTPVKLEVKKPEKQEGEGSEAGVGAPARITVYIPAGAVLWVDGKHRTRQTASLRLFETPDLKPGRTFSYIFRADFEHGGRTITESLRVEVRAGETTEVEFAELQAAAALPPERVQFTGAPEGMPPGKPDRDEE